MKFFVLFFSCFLNDHNFLLNRYLLLPTILTDKPMLLPTLPVRPKAASFEDDAVAFVIGDHAVFEFLVLCEGYAVLPHPDPLIVSVSASRPEILTREFVSNFDQSIVSLFILNGDKGAIQSFALGGGDLPGLGVFADPVFGFLSQELPLLLTILTNITSWAITTRIVPLHILVLIYLDAVLPLIKVVRLADLPVAVGGGGSVMPNPLVFLGDVIPSQPEHPFLPLD